MKDKCNFTLKHSFRVIDLDDMGWNYKKKFLCWLSLKVSKSDKKKISGIHLEGTANCNLWLIYDHDYYKRLFD